MIWSQRLVIPRVRNLLWRCTSKSFWHKVKVIPLLSASEVVLMSVSFCNSPGDPSFPPSASEWLSGLSPCCLHQVRWVEVTWEGRKGKERAIICSSLSVYTLSPLILITVSSYFLLALNRFHFPLSFFLRTKRENNHQKGVPRTLHFLKSSININ